MIVRAIYRCLLSLLKEDTLEPVLSLAGVYSLLKEDTLEPVLSLVGMNRVGGLDVGLDGGGRLDVLELGGPPHFLFFYSVKQCADLKFLNSVQDPDVKF